MCLYFVLGLVVFLKAPATPIIIYCTGILFFLTFLFFFRPATPA